LDIEPEPFDPLTYKGVEEEEARLRENVIRWRYKKDKNNNYLVRIYFIYNLLIFLYIFCINIYFFLIY